MENVGLMGFYEISPLVISHSYCKITIEIVDFPMKNMVIFQFSYVKLPEGIMWIMSTRDEETLVDKLCGSPKKQ